MGQRGIGMLEVSRALFRRSILAAIVTAGLASMLALSLVAPATAGAYAKLEGEPVFSVAPGLPDGRVYEQVSPADKNGNQAGSVSLKFTGFPPGTNRYSIASAEGDSVLFEGTGPMGETPTASLLFFVSTRTSSGWKTRSLQPRQQQSAEAVGPLSGNPAYILMSQDFSHAVVDTGSVYSLAPEAHTGEQFYLTGPDPFVPATWISRPEIENPILDLGGATQSNGVPVGGSPDLSTIYFTSSGTLLPEDVSRAPHAHQIGNTPVVEAFGFYEYREGVLREAGVLPDRRLDPFGAVPAASGHGESLIGNEVSQDGSRAFFVSPDPASCEQAGGQNDCVTDPPELYVREHGTKTVLVSQDTLSPEVGGLPAGAPGGVAQIPEQAIADRGYSNSRYVFASPDGSQAFFQSEDQLVSGAPEGPPGNASPKTYDFDVETGSLTYLPGVVGQIVASDGDGSSMVFVRPATRGQPAELDLWSAGPGGGSITEITQLPGSEEVEPVRMTSDGSVIVFTTGGLPGFKDETLPVEGHGGEIFRYDVEANTLSCVSCAPAGVASAAASMSTRREDGQEEALDLGDANPGVVDERGMSANGDRVFFQTRSPLVPQDSNTGDEIPGLEKEGLELQGMDVYEWEDGVVYLISTGKSSRNTYFLDNSESGNDVFFTTSDGLAANDLDGAYDVYDARVPRPGDNPPPAAVPCEGAVCEGPPRVQVPLGAPASETFSGLGNVPPEPVASLTVKPKAKSKATACKKGYVREKTKCVKQHKAKKSAKGRK